MSNPIFTTQAIPQKGVFNFGIGQPDPDILPLAIMQQASAHRFSLNDPGMLNYGYELGDGHFRLELAKLLSTQYGKPVSDRTLFLTTGSSGAIDLICTQFTQPGDVILVEDPTYFLVFDIFKDHGLKIVGVPLTENGYDWEALETAVKTHKPKLFYTIPTYQNPMTCSIPLAQREQLVALSQQHGFYVVADEVYQLLSYSDTPPPPYANFIDSELVLSVGTFSKILAPGLRVGWIQAHEKVTAQLALMGLTGSAGSLNHFTSNIVTSVMSLGLQDQYLMTLKEIYGRRIDLMDRLLFDHFGARSVNVYTKPAGGFFFWLTLDETLDTRELLKKAQSLKTGFVPGSSFSINQNFANCLRLSFAYYDETEIEQGMTRLLSVLPKE